MEAKKQIWGVGENMGTEESKKIQEAIQYLRQQDLKEEVIGYVRRHDTASV